MDGDHRPFGQDVESAVGDDGGDFQDFITLAVQTGHFQVYPDEVGGGVGHGLSGR